MLGDYLPPDPRADNPLNSQYYERKINDFQQLLYDLDSAANSANDLILATENDLPQFADDLRAMLDSLDAKKWSFKTAAEALNGAVSVANSAGMTFNTVRLPATLGLGPIAGGIAIAGILATCATLATFGQWWLDDLSGRTHQNDYLNWVSNIKDDALRDEATRSVLAIENAKLKTDDSMGGNIATMVKWGAIAALAYFGLQAFQKVK